MGRKVGKKKKHLNAKRKSMRNRIKNLVNSRKISHQNKSLANVNVIDTAMTVEVNETILAAPNVQMPSEPMCDDICMDIEIIDNTSASNVITSNNRNFDDLMICNSIPVSTNTDISYSNVDGYGVDIENSKEVTIITITDMDMTDGTSDSDFVTPCERDPDYSLIRDSISTEFDMIDETSVSDFLTPREKYPDNSLIPDSLCTEFNMNNSNSNELGKKNVNKSNNFNAAQDHDLIIELDSGPEKKESIDLVGRRIIDPDFLFSQIREHGVHKPFNCSFFDMDTIKEYRRGFHSTWTFRCRMCGLEQTMTSDNGSMDLTTAAVSGTILSGNANEALNRITTSLNIPPISSSTYSAKADKIYDHLNKICFEEMREAAEEEKRLARLRNDIDSDGMPFISVITDGAWCKRAYKNTYDSLGGTGVIVGAVTKKVLYIGVLNKYCLRCAMAENRNETALPHKCFKNWDSSKSSCSMETEAIVEGFRCSEELYGVRYRTLIADGDSSAFKKIKEIQPGVQKIECTNHLLRNFSNKLKDLCKSTSHHQKELKSLKTIISSKRLKWRTGIASAISHRQKEGYSDKTIENLKADVRNSISHIFGEHKHCKQLQYFCNGELKPNEINLIPSFMRYQIELWNPMQDYLNRLVDNCDSLLHNYTNNPAESYNSVSCKMIGGKRVNHTGSGGYQARNAAAVIAYNSGTPFTALHKAVTNENPGFFAQRNEAKNLSKRKNRPKEKKSKIYTTQPNSDYGVNVQRPDLSKEIFIEKRLEVIEKIRNSEEEVETIEKNTKNQSDDKEWYAERRCRITASMFGPICRMRDNTSSASTINKMLYSTYCSKAMKDGKENESTAVLQLSQETGTWIEKCGLFVHKNHGFIGASPDGLFKNHGIVEVKCPQYKEPVTTEDITMGETRKTLWKNNEINTTHHHYYQIQGQLEVTNKRYCLYYVWTPHSTALTKIKRSRKFWKQQMFPRLVQFYWSCLLPELIDPRHERGMPLRNVTITGASSEKKRANSEKRGKNV